MDNLFISCDGGAVAWTGGIKELLEKSQRSAEQHNCMGAAAHSCYHMGSTLYDARRSSVVEEYLEPTSVLEVGDRFSPPLISSPSSASSAASCSLHHRLDAAEIILNDDDAFTLYQTRDDITDQLLTAAHGNSHSSRQLAINSNAQQNILIDAAPAWPDEADLYIMHNDIIDYAPISSLVATQFCPMQPHHMNIIGNSTNLWSSYNLNGFGLLDSSFADFTCPHEISDVAAFNVADNQSSISTQTPSTGMMGSSSDQMFEDELVNMYINHGAEEGQDSIMTCHEEEESSNRDRGYIKNIDHEVLPQSLAGSCCNNNIPRRSPFNISTTARSISSLHDGTEDQPVRVLGRRSVSDLEYKEAAHGCMSLIQASSPFGDTDNSCTFLHSTQISAEEAAGCYGSTAGAFETVHELGQLDCMLQHSTWEPEKEAIAAGPRCTHEPLVVRPNQQYEDNNNNMQLVRGLQAESDSGLELVHLLLACAEAVAWRDLPLAVSLLDQLLLFASYTGDAIRRVTYCFAEGLAARLTIMSTEAPHHMRILTSPPVSQKKEGLLQLYQCSPYLSFGFFAANQAILQAFEKKTHVHIVDLGMIQNLQWPGLIRALATRAEGPPEVRITAFGAGIESLMEMTEWGRELREFAGTLKVPLEFRTMGEALDTSKLSIEALDVRECETLAINTVLQLHKVVKESRGSLKGVLQRLQRLGAGVMTLVEQDANHNGPFFLGRFLESLHYYSAIFDSLEASMGRHSQQRMKVERLYYAEEIRNIVACEGLERTERHERGDQWRRQMSRAGFQVVPLKFISQARMFMSLYSCDGYTLCEEKGCLLLGWKSKPIVLASAWRPPPTTTSTS